MDFSKYSGLELMQMISKGDLPPPPISEVIPMHPIKIEKGKVIFQGRASKKHANPMGGTHGGFIATLIDSATGCAVHTTLNPGDTYGTIELNVKMTKPVPIDVELFAEAVVTQTTKSLGIANCIVKDIDGKIYGHGSATCLIKRNTV